MAIVFVSRLYVSLFRCAFPRILFMLCGLRFSCICIYTWWYLICSPSSSLLLIWKSCTDHMCCLCFRSSFGAVLAHLSFSVPMSWFFLSLPFVIFSFSECICFLRIVNFYIMLLIFSLIWLWLLIIYFVAFWII